MTTIRLKFICKGRLNLANKTQHRLFGCCALYHMKEVGICYPIFTTILVELYLTTNIDFLKRHRYIHIKYNMKMVILHISVAILMFYIQRN